MVCKELITDDMEEKGVMLNRKYSELCKSEVIPARETFLNFNVVVLLKAYRIAFLSFLRQFTFDINISTHGFSNGGIRF